jgi:hypothetical protein
MKNLVTILVLILSTYDVTRCQSYMIAPEKAPRIKPFYDKPGVYELVTRVNKLQVEGGDTVVINVFITGYGEISKYKLYYQPSASFFDTAESKIIDTLQLTNSGKSARWGYSERKLISVFGTSMTMPWFHNKYWKDSTFIYDTDTNMRFYSIITEAPTTIDNFLTHKKKDGNLEYEKIGTSVTFPLTFKLLVKHNIDPGNYDFNLYFTYYNGQEWKMSKSATTILYKNVIQRWEIPIWILGFFGVLAVLISLFKETRSFVLWCKNSKKPNKNKLPIVAAPPAAKPTNTSDKLIIEIVHIQKDETKSARILKKRKN